jgi:uncharacterized protein with HEPN domain
MHKEILIDKIELIEESIRVIKKRLENILESDDLVKSDEGLTILDSIAMRLQVIGESVKEINTKYISLEDKYPFIEWKKIIKFRDLVSHHYDVINHKIVYDICKMHLDKLKETMLDLKTSL